MTYSRIATRPAVTLSTAALVASLLFAADAGAQSIPSKPKGDAATAAAAKKKDGAEAQKNVAAGLKAYEGGKLDAAVASLSEGLRLGGLPSQQMAKALYIRGLAYRKQGKPALAISDLTSAVWLKGGLSDTERSDAMENRVAAYREAGLGDGVTGPRPQQQKAATTAAATTSSGSGTGWQTATLDSSSAVTKAPSSASSPSFGLAQTETTPEPQSSGTSVGSFFNNLFGSSSSSAQPAPSVQQAAPPQPQQPKTAAAAAPAEGWGDATKVSKSRTETRVAAVGPAAAPAAVAAPAAAPQVAPAASGKFKLQVAAVRSRADAEAVAAKLKKEHAFRLDAREPVVDEAVYGNMGTFYRVRVGPYADANEPKQLCSSLKTSGFDCMVVAK